jgi:glutaminyl-tRNA synthetase
LSQYVSVVKEEKKAAKEKVADNKEEEEEGAATIAELMKNKVHFHAPGQNHTTDGYIVTPNTERILREHLARTGGQVDLRSFNDNGT